MMRRDKPLVSALRTALEKVLGGDPAQRLFVVEGILRPTFEAFPKNSAGKIALQSLHSIARSYFAEEHGWLFTGFEFAGPRSTTLSEAKLLRDKASDVVHALEEAQKKPDENGMSLSDTVAAIAAVEHLVLSETVPLLDRSYKLNDLSKTGTITKAALEEILRSYLILFREGRKTKHNTTDPVDHHAVKTEFLNSGDVEALKKFSDFYKESMESQAAKSEYTLADTLPIVKDMALRYGKWQNSECEDMKGALMELDPGKTGRVAIDRFHAYPRQKTFAFTETAEYLRKISSLDESRKGHPRVMIANYLASPSNCIAWSDYFSVCCLNECESLVNELESRVQTTDVPVQKLLDAVAEISSSTVKAPRKLPEKLVGLAHDVGAIHGGVMPLQGGDFRRWFHYIFPHECPYPTDLEATVAEGERDASERFAVMGTNDEDSPPTPEVPHMTGSEYSASGANKDL